MGFTGSFWVSGCISTPRYELLKGALGPFHRRCCRKGLSEPFHWLSAEPKLSAGGDYFTYVQASGVLPGRLTGVGLLVGGGWVGREEGKAPGWTALNESLEKLT